MNWRNSLKLVVAAAALSSPAAHALTLDWSGYFRATNENIFDYQMNKATPGYSSMNGGQGEDIPGQGSKNATYSTMFLKLKPKVLVNDNIIVHTEWNVGDPKNGFFGRNVPQEDRNNPLSTGKDGMSITASRLWLDVHSDFGTVQVGRAPMHWGLGVVFNSGDNPFDPTRALRTPSATSPSSATSASCRSSRRARWVRAWPAHRIPSPAR